MILPTAVERDVKERFGSGEPALSLRSLSSIGGDLGESYVLTDGETIWLYSRQAGSEFECHELPLRELADVRSREDAPYLFLELELEDGILELQFSTFDAAGLTRLRELWQAAGGGRQAAPAASPPAADCQPSSDEAARPAVAPLEGFCAALHAVANADTTVAPEELSNLERLVGDAALLEAGHDLWQELGTDGLIQSLAQSLSPRQKLCLLANLIDLAMVDGTLRGIEKETIRWFREGLNIDDSNYQALFDALLLKNNIGIFQTDGDA